MYNISKPGNNHHPWMAHYPLSLLIFVLLLWTSPSTALHSPKLYLFDCGQLLFDSVEGFGLSNDETDIRTLAVPCYLIKHKDGTLLWDAGLPSHFQSDVWMEIEGFPGSYSRMSRTLESQLEELYLTWQDIDYAAFSHTHFDHMGAANELTGSVVIIQEPEFEAAFADTVTATGFVPSTYKQLQGAEFMIIDGDHDVFNDGSVRILSTPGHTPGHQSLFIDLADYGPLVLSGDLYHFRFNREHRRYPVFNSDGDATLRSIDRMEELIEETGATLWIQHDLVLFEELKKVPLYYQ